MIETSKEGGPVTHKKSQDAEEEYCGLPYRMLQKHHKELRGLVQTYQLQNRFQKAEREEQSP
jgi:hypothetical protein